MNRAQRRAQTYARQPIEHSVKVRSATPCPETIGGAVVRPTPSSPQPSNGSRRTTVDTKTELHILRSPQNDIVLAHAHDERSFRFIQSLLDIDWPGGDWVAASWSEHALFPLERADELVEMARFEGIEVIDGPECD